MGEENNAGVVVLRSPRLVAAGVRHGFSTRVGGVSVDPFASMNLARAVGDDLDAVAENHRRFAAAVGYAADRLHESSQVHGAAVVSVRGPDVLATRTLSADALVATEPGDAVAVRVADCVPVLLAVPGRGVAAGVPTSYAYAHARDRTWETRQSRCRSNSKRAGEHSVCGRTCRWRRR